MDLKAVYDNVNQEEYLDAIHVSLEEFQIIFFENDLTTMFISESIQNDIGKWTTLVEEDIQC